MKKFLLMASALLVLAGMYSCNDPFHEISDIPLVEFNSRTYALDADSIVLKVCTPYNLDAPLEIPFTVSGNAENGKDYKLYAQRSITIPAGRNFAYISVKALKYAAGDAKKLTIKLNPGYVYHLGEVSSATVTLNRKEPLNYWFDLSGGNLLSYYDVTVYVSRTGERWSDFSAPAAIKLPVKISDHSTAKLGTDFTIDNNATAFVIPAGGNSAKIRIRTSPGAAINLSNMKFVRLGVDTEAVADRTLTADTRNNYKETTVYIRGEVKLEDFIGHWKHSRSIHASSDDIDDSPLFVSDLLPWHNAGFTIDIAKDEATGDIKFIPAGNGTDLMSLFREATMTFTAPINMHTAGIGSRYVAPTLLNDHTSIEGNTWVNFNVKPQLTYVRLSDANRSFDNNNESLNPMSIALMMSPGSNSTLYLFLRDYDCPPFANLGWSDASFNTYYGFFYVFTK